MTKEIIIGLSSKLDALLSEKDPPQGDLMEKTFHYLNTFWIQLFAYTHDGSYTINNSVAERLYSFWQKCVKTLCFSAAERWPVYQRDHIYLQDAKHSCAEIFQRILQRDSAWLYRL